MEPSNRSHCNREVPFVRALASYGDRLAVVTDDETEITYRQLAASVSAVAERLGAVRRLVLLEASNDLESLVTYLGALHGGHPVMLVPPGDHGTRDTRSTVYDPDVTCSPDAGSLVFEERRRGSVHVLHPDLSLLLSTSGSTGSPKLVRLSQRNVESNARAIGQFLDIRATDRAVASLPMHYCYGLSVINSHLARGAALLLTSDSVVEPRFWSRFRRYGATSLAGVPYTFDLLERVGFEHMHLPTLRYVTQAGGRLAPTAVHRFARLGEKHGWKLFVMYGQTEATARMAFLPPDEAVAYPAAIGMPIPGGSFALEPLPDSSAMGEGELIYRGPNVMLGYAEGPDDLALGRVIDELRTGDTARVNERGFYELLRRKHRFVKLFGLRIDLERIERRLEDARYVAACAGTDERLVVAVTAPADLDMVCAVVAAEAAVPQRCVHVREVVELPRLANGKPDHAAIARLGADEPAPVCAEQEEDPHDIKTMFAAVLDVGDIDDDATFVSLGGDSLSYVEASLCLEEMLGHIPDGWHRMPVRELQTLAPRRRRLKRMETGVVLRAASIFLVVATHVRWLGLQGGAHLLLAISGYNFARFQLLPRAEPIRHALTSIARIAVPTVTCIALTFWVTDLDRTGRWLLVSNYTDGGVWRYWYVEVLLQVLVALTLLFRVSPIRRWEQAAPYRFAMVALVVTAAASYLHLRIGAPDNRIYVTHLAAWIFVLGWATERAVTIVQKILVSGFCAVAVWPFFDQGSREALVLGGVLLLTWMPAVRVPAPLARLLGLVAGASLYIYLVHFELYHRLDEYFPQSVIVALALAAGLVTWLLARRLTRAVVRLARRVLLNRGDVDAPILARVEPACASANRSPVGQALARRGLGVRA